MLHHPGLIALLNRNRLPEIGFVPQIHISWCCQPLLLAMDTSWSAKDWKPTADAESTEYDRPDLPVCI
jgi:hypothetical protein